MRLIDADALEAALHNFFDGKVINEPAYILRDVFCYIDSAPTVENITVFCENADKKTTEELKAELERVKTELRPKGKWVEGYHDYFLTHDCSICGHSKEGTHLQYNFCPNCGADMRGDEDGNMGTKP